MKLEVFRESIVKGHRIYLLSLLSAFVALAGFLCVLAVKKGQSSAQTEPAQTQAAPETFLRPGMLSRGGTYEVYLDVEHAEFNANSVVDTGTMNIAVMSSALRSAKGLTLTLGIASRQPEGLVPLTVSTPLADGTVQSFVVNLKVVAGTPAGPQLTFKNLPAGDRLISESGYAHFEVAIDGNGPFIFEYGLRNRPFWVSRKWNALGRNFAEEQKLAMSGSEEEAFEVVLPETVNIVDLVAIDANGIESYQSLVVESQAPADMDHLIEVGLLEKFLGKRVACADCTNTDPPFTYFVQSCAGIDQNQDNATCTSPTRYTGSTCQGTLCHGCGSCRGGSLLTVAPGAAAGGGYDRPDGYSPPLGMTRQIGVVFPHSGEYLYSVTDLSFPVPGLDFAITRTYRTQISYHGILGFNWDANFLARYLRYGTVSGSSASAAGDMYYYGGDGRRDRYIYDAVGGVFQSPNGFFDKFAFSSSAISQEIRHKDGRRYLFSETQVGPTAVRGRISAIYDRTGLNSITFGYDLSGKLTTITSSTGISFTVQYNGSYISRIYETQDSTNEVLYTYNTTPGHDPVLEKAEYASTTFYDFSGENLTTYATSRKKVIYEYNLAGTGDLKYNLLNVYDGKGNTGVEKTYRAVALAYDTSDRVQTMTTDPDTAGAAWVGSTLSFTLYGTDGFGNRLTQYQISGYDSQATPVNQVLRKFEMTFDPSSGGLLSKTIKTASGGIVATWTYERACPCNLPTKITDPLGRVEDQTYDSYGNLTQRVLEGATGTADDIVSWFKYEAPYYVDATKYGRILESAQPEVVKDYYPTQTIANVPAAKKTRYTYTGVNLTKFQPPDFTDASEYGGSTHQAEISYTYNSNGQVLTRTTKLDLALLHKTQYTYYTTGNRKSLVQDVTEDPDAGGLQLKTTYDYNNRGDLLSIKDPKGQTSGFVTAFTFPGDRVVSTIKPPNSTSDGWTNLRFDANDNLVGKDEGGNATLQRMATFFKSDRVNHNTKVKQELTGDTDPLTANGTIDTIYDRDAEGRVRKVTEPGSKVTQSEYSFVLNTDYYWTQKDFLSGTGVSEYQTRQTQIKKNVDLTTVKDFIDATTSATTSFVYDEYGRREFTVTGPSTSVFYGELLSYNRDGDLVAVEKDEKTSAGSSLDQTLYTFKNVVYKDHDELDRPIRETRYQNYSRLGSNPTPGTQTDPITHVTKHGYDGQVLIRRKVLDSGNSDTSSSYDIVSRLTVTTYPDGQSQLRNDTLDSNGNVTKIVSREYDGVSTKDYVTYRSYDDRNRMTEEVIEGFNNASRALDYQRMTFTYDFRSNLKQRVWDVKNTTNDVVTSYTYDGLNRQTNVTYNTNGSNISNQTIYDDASRTITKRDGKNQDTIHYMRAERDAVRKIKYAADAPPTNPDNEYFDYDRRGALTKQTRASASDPPTGTWDITYTNDLLGRVTQRSLNSATGSGQETIADFTYDYQGRILTAKTKLEGSSAYKTSVTRTYNSMYLTQEDQLKFNAVPVFTVKTTGGTGTGYDKGGRRIRLEYENDTNLSTTRVLDYQFDSSDRMQSIGWGSSILASYSYIGPSERVNSATLYGYGTIVPKLTKNLTYDHLRRPTLTDYRVSGGGSIMSYAEGWGDGTQDTDPTKKYQVFNRKTYQQSGGTNHAFCYDGLGCFAREGADVERIYDAATNRTGKGPTGSAITYTYNNASNQLTAISSPATTVLHDLRGNLTKKDRTSGTDDIFTYDLLNRLDKYETSPASSTWRYYEDALGRRVAKTKGTESHYYFYDGNRVVVELIDTGSLSVKEYIYGNGIDEVLVERLPDGGSPNTFWPMADTLGTFHHLADLDGSVNPRVRMTYGYYSSDFDPDGTLTGETPASGTSAVFQEVFFTGRTLDRESKLYFYRARYFDPEIGRFLSRDPVGIWFDPVGRGNGYGYVGNDFINKTDPFGYGPWLGGIWDAIVKGKIFEAVEKIVTGILSAVGYVVQYVVDKAHDLVDPDTDGDGMRDSVDPDDDNDGVPDEEDVRPKDPNI